VRFLPLMLALPATFAVAPVTLAQDAASSATQNGVRTFTPSYFVSFSPVSALEMVERVPGFSINGGDDRRGFGANAGNVLIDGDRPSTKSDDIRTILSRIPAEQVLRLELTEQAGSAADARGQAQTLNIVRKTGGALSGTYSASVELGETEDISPFGEASVSLKRGVTTYDLSAAYARQFNRITGPQTTRDASGRRTQISDQLLRNGFREASVRGALKTRAGDTKIGLNLGVEQERTRILRTADILDGKNQLLGSEFLRERSPARETEYEIGGDIETPVTTKLTSKLIGLYNLNKFSGDGFVENKRTGLADDIFRSQTRNRETETILRLQNDWAVAADHAVQFGGEIALNRLRANFQASSSQNGAITNLPASNVRVKEWRYEPFVSDVWTINPDWKLEAGLIFERSKLTVSGDSTASRTLQFLKPRTVATWTLDSKSSIEFRVQRDVGQLDFNDFATSVDLGADGLVDAGNSELVPEKVWTIATTWRQKFWDRGSIQLEGSYDLVSDTQDLLLITQRDARGAIISRFDGAGNIGNARRWNIEFEVTLPLDRFTRFASLSGMEIKYVGHYHGSRVTDPVTGLTRRISNRPQHHHDVNFRHDLASSGFSWGFDMSYAAPRYRYFFNQIERSSETSPEFFAWVEYRKWSYGTLRFQAGNPTDIGIDRSFTIYRDTRATNDIIRSTSRNRSRDTRFLFSLTGKF
jgi:hypothetical protein